MSWRPGEPHEFSAGRRARVHRQFERALDARYPGYRHRIVPATEVVALQATTDDTPREDPPT